MKKGGNTSKHRTREIEIQLHDDEEVEKRKKKPCTRVKRR